MLVKLLSQETDLAAATDVDAATVVRLLNTAGAPVLVTVKDGATVVATVTLGAGEVSHIQKRSAQTLTASVDVKAVKLAYAN